MWTKVVWLLLALSLWGVSGCSRYLSGPADRALTADAATDTNDAASDLFGDATGVADGASDSADAAAHLDGGPTSLDGPALDRDQREEGLDQNLSPPDQGEDTLAGDMSLVDQTPAHDLASVDVFPPSDVDPTNHVYIIQSGTNLILAELAVGHGAPQGAHIRFIVPQGAIVGATTSSTPAIASGDLSRYSQVVLEISGEIQGAGGGSGGSGAVDGGDALALTSSLCLHVTSTGAIRAGGGGGGAGGSGGDGNDVGPWSAWMYSETAPKSFWSPSWNYIAWNGVHDIAVGQMCCNYAFEGGWAYEKGAQETVSPLPILFRVRRADILFGTPGKGGAGGQGQGYNQLATSGDKGTVGSHRAGRGGAGGGGGAWGEAGNPGITGSAGLVYAATSSGELRAGHPGEAGGTAGLAINAAGLSLPFLNEGVILGDTDFLAESPCGP